jgi:hypothetical protein
MLTARQRNLYIGIIAFCVLGSILVFVMRNQRVAPAEAPASPTALEPLNTGGQQTTTGFIPVYPQNRTFDTGFFESGTYKLLKSYESLQVDESELGVEDPFKPL